MNLKDDEVPEKSKIHREHMERVRIQMAAEEEALKFSRTIKGVDQKKYKDIRYAPAENEMADRMKLDVMRFYQFFIGVMGLIGVGLIFWGINKPILFMPISKTFVMEINMIFLGCALAVAGVIGIIGFQHKHDKISDRLYGKQRVRIVTKRK